MVPFAPCSDHALQVEDIVSPVILNLRWLIKMLFRSLISVLAVAQTQAALLQDIQVAPPVLTPSGLTNGSSSGFPSGLDPQGCVVQQVLVDHVFAYSYGQPFIGQDPTASERGRLLIVARYLQSSIMRFQSSDLELDGDLTRPPIRSSWRYLPW